MGRLGFLLTSIILAVAANLVFCRWGINCSESAVLTMYTDTGPRDDGEGIEVAGLFAAPWLEHSPSLALGLGVLLPMVLLGIGTYAAVRRDDEVGNPDPPVGN